MFVCAECGASQPYEGRCIADGSPLMPTGDDVLLGMTIGAYRVARLLGVGGMGRVYKGVHPQIGSRVAIKVLSRECSDRRDLVDRFFAEAKAVNLIRHESIVNVLDLATLPDGRPYIVMEYLDGSPLASIVEHAQMSGTPLPLGGLARLIAEVLDALGAAHAKGIIHRDLKPDNIYVTPSGRPKVLDFGIAKLQPELGGSATHTGSLLGTPHYMSPEQAAGRTVDLRADIYALGVILFECATLQKPFVADALFDLLRKHIEAPPPSPCALRRDMPPALEHVIYTALAKMPDQRFGSTAQMSMALQQATMQLPPDQWAPLVPAQANRPGSWAPTPPQSWSSQNRGGPTVPNTSTATAGQVSPLRASGSKKGLWIALGAIGVVGVGITIAVLAGGGSSSGAGSGAGSGSVVAAGSATEPAGSQAAPVGSAAQPEEPDEPETPETPRTPTTPPPKKSSLTKAARDQIKASQAALEQNWSPAVDAAFGQSIDSLPEASRKVLPKDLKAALKKYGSWSKIPADLRKKLALQFSDPDQWDTAAAMAGGATDAPDTRPPTPDKGGWVSSHRWSPAGYNPKALDVDKYLPIAMAEAKKLVPDAVLFRIDAAGVQPNGRADITAVEHGDLDYRFISPSRSKKDPNAPLGAKHEWKCMFRIMFDEQGAWAAPMDGWECKETLIGPPKCSAVQVWKKAMAKKAPTNAFGSLGYRAWDGKAKWYFSIEGTQISEVFDDDC